MHDLPHADNAQQDLPPRPVISAARFEAVLNRIDQAVELYDAAGRLMWANRTAIDAYGLDPTEHGRAELARMLFVRRPDGRPVAIDDLPSSRALRGQTVEDELFAFTRPDGGEVEIVASAWPLPAGDGQAGGAFVSWHPLNEQGQAQQALERMAADRNALESRVAERTADLQQVVAALHQEVRERADAEDEIRRLNAELEARVAERTAQLERANAEMETFSYSVSHDLRAPLRAIDGYTSFIEEQAGALDGEARRYLAAVRENVRRMAQLIDDLLRFARTGRQAPRFEPTDMTALVRYVFEPLRAGAPIPVELELGSLPAALCDPTVIDHVWTNLLENAIKFSRPKGRARIEISGRVEGDQAVYVVTDHGVGFDNQYVDKLFIVFQRLHSIDDFPGSGVGLALAARIVHRHGGTISAESRLGEGATFTFTLPKA